MDRIDIRIGRKPRGFAAMSKETQRMLAARGGRAVPAAKRSFMRDRALAVEAGRKGGLSRSKGAARKTGGGEP